MAASDSTGYIESLRATVGKLRSTIRKAKTTIYTLVVVFLLEKTHLYCCYESLRLQ